MPRSVTVRDTAGTALPLAQDGTDSSDPNASQAAAGVGLRGWLSTLVSLLRAGTARVLVREVAQTQVNVGQLSVTTTATLIRSATTARTVCTLRTIGGAASADLYLGSSSAVVPATGFLLRASSYDSQDIKWTGAIYGITASGTATVAYWEEIQ